MWSVVNSCFKLLHKFKIIKLNTLFTGRNLIHVARLSSTNDWAMQLLFSSRPVEGTLIWADYQTHGRGQRGNTWEAAKGENLTFSLIFYPTFLRPTQLFRLCKMISVAICEYLQELLPGQKVHIKWPNDILVNRKKVAGILIENQLGVNRVNASVIGIGLNVNQAEFPEELGGKSCALCFFTQQEWDRQTVLEGLLQRIESLYLALRHDKIGGINRTYLQNLYAYQEKVPIRIGDTWEEFTIVGVNEMGQLAVEEDGKLRYFNVREAHIFY